MELNWTTLLLEIVNFLVLVWLLKRFLYQPVRAAIEQRRVSIEEQLLKVRQQKKDVDEMRQRYENRLHDWEEERERSRQKLQRDIEEERKQLRKKLQQNLEMEREKAEVLAARQVEEQQREREQQSMQQGAQFVARLLSRISSPELESKLFELLLEDLRALPSPQREALQSIDASKTVEVVSAYELTAQQQRLLEKALSVLLSSQPQFRFARDENLIAGLRITAGPWVLHANLHDELSSFASIAHES